MTLLLYSDKNKFKDDEGAFKIISEAWNIILDKSKRNFYDKKRNYKESLHKIETLETFGHVV